MSPAISIDWAYWQRHRAQALATGAKQAKYLLAPEMTRLVRCPDDWRHELLFSTLWYTGAKIGEVLALKGSDVITESGAQAVRYPNKNGAPRSVEVTDAYFLSVLERGVRESGKDRSQAILGVTRQSASQWLKARVETLNGRVPGGFTEFDVTFNTFRHSFAFNALLHAVPLQTLQHWLGHSNPEMTRRYMSYLGDDPREHMARIGFS